MVARHRMSEKNQDSPNSPPTTRGSTDTPLAQPLPSRQQPSNTAMPQWLLAAIQRSNAATTQPQISQQQPSITTTAQSQQTEISRIPRSSNSRTTIQSRLPRRHRERNSTTTTSANRHRSRSPRARSEADSTSQDDHVTETAARVRNGRSLSINIGPNLGTLSRNTYVPNLSGYQPVLAAGVSRQQERGQQNRARRHASRSRRSSATSSTLSRRDSSTPAASSELIRVTPRTSAPDTITTSTATSSALTHNDNSTVSQSAASASTRHRETNNRRRIIPPRVETLRQPRNDVTRATIPILPRRDLGNDVHRIRNRDRDRESRRSVVSSPSTDEPSSSETGSSISSVVTYDRLNLRRRSLRSNARSSTSTEYTLTFAETDSDPEPSTSRGSRLGIDSYFRSGATTEPSEATETIFSGDSENNPIVIIEESSPDSDVAAEREWWLAYDEGRLLPDLPDIDFEDDREYDPDVEESSSEDDLYQYTNEDVRRSTVVEADSGASCTICLDGLCVGEEVGELPCKHKFHMPCITRWMMRSKTCPLCRTRVPLRHHIGVP